MASFSEFARRKVFGVPVIYLALGAVIILGIVAWRMKPSTPSTGDEGTPPDSAGPGTETGDDYTGLTTTGTVVVQPSTLPAEEKKEETNETWERAAVTHLVDSKLATVGAAQSAIHLYLEGGDLSYEQGILRDEAVKKLGLPPEGLPIVGRTSNAPAQKQFSNFPGTHTVKNENDNSASKLAMLYYNNADNLHQNLIVSSNFELGPIGSTYTSGTKVKIPVWTNPRYYAATKETRYPTQIAAKNGISYRQLLALNPQITFPVNVGTKVRVG